jgi:3-oxoisoapionate decarboxylase
VFAGIGSYTFPWAFALNNQNKMPALQLLDYAKNHEIGFVQFGDNFPLHALDKEALQDIKNFAEENNIQLEVGTRRLTVENAQRYISIAKFFNSPFLRMVIDDEDYHPHEEEVIAVIKEILPDLKNNFIVLAIENHDRFKAATLKRIITQTDGAYTGICLDTANSLGAGEGIHEVLQVLKHHVVNLHIKDITIKRVADKMGFIVEGTAAGEGMINIPSIIHQLNETGRCKTATLEIWSNTAGTIEETISKEKQLAEKSIHYIKQFLS